MQAQFPASRGATAADLKSPASHAAEFFQGLQIDQRRWNIKTVEPYRHGFPKLA